MNDPNDTDHPNTPGEVEGNDEGNGHGVPTTGFGADPLTAGGGGDFGGGGGGVHGPRPGGGVGSYGVGRWLLILGGVGFAGLLLCGGVGTLIYRAVESLFEPAIALRLPPDERDFFSDLQAFNRSMADAAASPIEHDSAKFAAQTTDQSLVDFIKRLKIEIDNNEEPALNQEGFKAAVLADPVFGEQFGLLEKISLDESLDFYAPSPFFAGWSGGRVVGLRHSPGDSLAEIDLLLHGDAGMCESQQWYLIKSDAGVWSVYDWQDLDIGRRVSAEFAGYFAPGRQHAEGLDLALRVIEEAEGEFLSDNGRRGAELLRQAETQATLPNDRPHMMYRIAIAWENADRPDEVLRVLAKIRSPDEMIGLWPMKTRALLRLGRLDEADQTLDYAAAVTPNHPNVESLRAELCARLGQPTRAAEYTTAALRLCPSDPALFLAACRAFAAAPSINDSDSADSDGYLDPLVDALLADPELPHLSALLNQLETQAVTPTRLVRAIETKADAPAGLSELVTAVSLLRARRDAAMVAGGRDDAEAANRAGDGDGDSTAVDDAAQRLLAAQQSPDATVARLASDRLYALRAAADDFERLFTESRDLAATLRGIVVTAIDNGLYVDGEALLRGVTAIEQSEDAEIRRVVATDGHWVRGVKAHAYFLAEQYPASVTEFDALRSWAQRNVGVNDEADGLVEDADYYLREALIESGDVEEFLRRWPDDASEHMLLGNRLIARDTSPAILGGGDRLTKIAAASSEISLRLQSSRVQAARAARAGDAVACDAAHAAACRSAAELAGRIDDYAVDLVHKRRGEDLARLRAFPAELIDAGNPPPSLVDFQTSLRTLLTEAAKRDDLQLARRWFRHYFVNDDSGWMIADDLNAKITTTYARLLLDQGVYNQAAANYRRAINLTSVGEMGMVSDDDADETRAMLRRDAYRGLILATVRAAEPPVTGFAEIESLVAEYTEGLSGDEPADAIPMKAYAAVAYANRRVPESESEAEFESGSEPDAEPEFNVEAVLRAAFDVPTAGGSPTKFGVSTRLLALFDRIPRGDGMTPRPWVRAMLQNWQPGVSQYGDRGRIALVYQIPNSSLAEIAVRVIQSIAPEETRGPDTVVRDVAVGPVPSVDAPSVDAPSPSDRFLVRCITSAGADPTESNRGLFPGDRLLVSVERGTIDTSDLPTDADWVARIDAGIDAGTLVQVTLAMRSIHPRVKHRLIELGRRIATDQTILADLHWIDSALVADSIPEALEIAGPISGRSDWYDGWLWFARAENTDDADGWNQSLPSGVLPMASELPASELPAYLRVTRLSVTEWVPVTILGSGSRESQLLVRADRNSVLHPLVVAGTRHTVNRVDLSGR